MRKIKLQMQLSLDGFVSGPNGEMDWMAWDWDDEIKKYVTELTDSADTLLMGRILYQGMSMHWPAIAAKAKSEKGDIEFADRMNSTPKIVFSKTLEKADWTNTSLLSGNIEEEIYRLKQQSGKDLLLYGGAGLVSSFVKSGLIDEYHLFINPAAIGNGKSIFKKVENKVKLKLVKSQSFPCGIALLCYEPVK
jgi:dihydrofolate reductase